MRLATAVRDALKAQPDIVALLPGGIYDQPLVPPEELSDDNDANDETAESEYMYDVTPDAFQPMPEGAIADGAPVPFIPGQARRCVSIIVPPRTAGRVNWNVPADVVDVYFYGPETAAEEALLEEARQKVTRYLTSRFLHPSGAGCVINPANEGVPFGTAPELVWSIGGMDRFLAVWFPE